MLLIFNNAVYEETFRPGWLLTRRLILASPKAITAFAFRNPHFILVDYLPRKLVGFTGVPDYSTVLSDG
jgi:hypothetical protein